jgi:arylsulfatase
LYFELNRFGNRSGQVVSSDPLLPGETHIVVNVEPVAEKAAHVAGLYAVQKPRPATVTLNVNGKKEGAGRFQNVEGRIDESLDIGCDLGSPVSPAYHSPDRFTGKIEKVVVHLQ